MELTVENHAALSTEGKGDSVSMDSSHCETLQVVTFGLFNQSWLHHWTVLVTLREIGF